MLHLKADDRIVFVTGFVGEDIHACGGRSPLRFSVGTGFQTFLYEDTEFLGKLPYRPIVSAFTATATAEVKADIIKMLELREPFHHNHRL